MNWLKRKIRNWLEVRHNPEWTDQQCQEWRESLEKYYDELISSQASTERASHE